MHIFRFFIFIGDATVTICHRYTPPEQLHVFTKTADIIVVAAGIPKLITADMVKEGVAVIDIGINRIVDEKTGKTQLVGDVDFEGKILYIYCTLLVVRGNTHVLPSICLYIRSETIKVKSMLDFGLNHFFCSGIIPFNMSISWILLKQESVNRHVVPLLMHYPDSKPTH
jgi:hypothetical protein